MECGMRLARFLGSMPHTQTSVSKQDKSVLRVYRNKTEMKLGSCVSYAGSMGELNPEIGIDKALERIT